MSDIIIPGAARSFYRVGGRDYQQDARFPDMDLPPQGFRSFIVCDGVGGQADGEVASATVCQAFAEFMAGYANPAYEFTQASFREAISFAYHRLLREIGERSTNMATTLTFLHLNSHNAMVAHIGDSRVYHIRPKVGVMYRTSDHSLVNMLVHAGTITPEQAINHPESNVITRSMCYVEPGAEPSAADVIVLNDIEAGDYFLLCTDGVLHDIDDEYLVNLFSSDLTEDDILAHLANSCEGSSDNNTAIIVRIETAPRAASAVGDFEPNEEVETVGPANPSEEVMESSETPEAQWQPSAPEVPTDQWGHAATELPADQWGQNPPVPMDETEAQYGYPTAGMENPQPEIMQIAPSNELPFHKRIANRIRNLFSR